MTLTDGKSLQAKTKFRFSRTQNKVPEFILGAIKVITGN